MYEEIIELINKGEINKAQEQIEKIPDDDPKKYNLKGLIHFNKKELEKAKEQFEKGLTINPVDSDLLFNYGYLLKEMNQEMKSWRYLMRIHEKDWATYDLLGDIEFKNRSKLASLRFYLKAAELTDNPQMKKKFLEIRNNIKKDTKIAFLCLPGLDNFLKDIVETFPLGYEVKLVVSTDVNEITQAIKWADIVWLEWANDLAVFATNKVPEIANKKVICRLHRYEAFTQFPEKINWRNIDRLIFVANSMKLTFHQLHPNVDLQSCKEEIVYNGVDLDKFKYSIHNPGYNLAVLAHINYRKNPETWIQIIGKLKEIDNQYKLHVGGDFQDPLYKEYFDYIKKEMKMEDNFILHGWINEVEKFLEDKNYIISTSIHEGHPYNILESMARGIKPIILNYSGSKEQWPNELIYNTIDEAVEKITEENYDSESYRRFIEDNYTLEEQIHEVEEIIAYPKKDLSINYLKKNVNDLKISYVMPVYNGEKFIEKSLSSILKQKIKPYEIIIIDDASTDNSYKILSKYQKRFQNIKLFRNNKNLGEYQTTKELLRKANGDFVKVLHQDDGIYENYALEISQINNIYKYSFIVNDYTYITEKNIISNYLKKIWNNFKLDPNKLNKEDLLKFLLISGNYFGGPSNVLFNREKLLKIYYSQYVEKLISQNLFYGYDYYLFLKLLEGGEVYVLFKDLSFRVEHSKNQTANNISSLFRVAGYYNILKIFENHLNEREKKLAYSNLFGRAMYSINSCKNKEEKNKMVQFVLNNYKYLTIDEKSKLNQMLQNI
jgi:glycosyltransferase involved in cell wall biosynthesis